MKFSFLILFLFPLIHLNAQDEYRIDQNNNALKISPIELSNSEFQLSYERFFNNKQLSIIFTPTLILKDNFDRNLEGYQGNIQFRFYIKHFKTNQGQTLFGFYGATYGQYLYSTEVHSRIMDDPSYGEGETEDFHKDVKALESGALVGVQMNVTQTIVIDLTFGLGVRKAYTQEDNITMLSDAGHYETQKIFEPEDQGFKQKLGLQIGIAF